VLADVAPKYTRPENERRFLVDPEAVDRTGPCQLVEDLYLSCGLLRLRRITELATGERTFKLAKKFASVSAFTRPLVCIYLDESEYEALAVLDGRELRKHRYHCDDQGYRWAIDVFTGPLAALALTEVETATLAELHSLQPPPWASYEVTEDPFFSGGRLCTATLAELRAKLSSRR
jgi:CYTH domain-containing protein